MATLRVVLDTNVLLSGIAYPASVPGKIMAAWRHGSVDVLLSAYILVELRRVLPRLAQRHGLTLAEIDDSPSCFTMRTSLILCSYVIVAVALFSTAQTVLMPACLKPRQKPPIPAA